MKSRLRLGNGCAVMKVKTGKRLCRDEAAEAEGRSLKYILVPVAHTMGKHVPRTCTVLTLAPALPLTCWTMCVQLPVTGSQVRSTPLELPVTIAMPSGVREMQSTLSAGPCECGEGYKTLW